MIQENNNENTLMVLRMRIPKPHINVPTFFFFTFGKPGHKNSDCRSKFWKYLINNSKKTPSPMLVANLDIKRESHFVKNVEHVSERIHFCFQVYEIPFPTKMVYLSIVEPQLITDKSKLIRFDNDF